MQRPTPQGQRALRRTRLVGETVFAVNGMVFGVNNHDGRDLRENEGRERQGT